MQLTVTLINTMVIWRSLSPLVLARVLEFALKRERPDTRQRPAEGQRAEPKTRDDPGSQPAGLADRGRQREHGAQAAEGRILERDGAVVELGDVADDGEAEAAAGHCSSRRVPRSKTAVALVGGQAGAVVVDGDEVYGRRRRARRSTRAAAPICRRCR